MKNYIKDFWDDSAEKFKCDSRVSWGDNFLLNLEYNIISKYLKNNMKILDAGCANGFATIEHAQKNINSNFTGLDFSTKMINYANINKLSIGIKNIEFEVGDITDMSYEDNTFDIVYTTRVLINLPTWEDQQKGLLECLRVVKNNGLVVILEGFYEPFIKLNSLRQISGLSPLEEHDFNRYIKKYRLEKFISDNNYKFENIDFSSVYYIGSRFLRELITDYKSFDGFTNPILEEFYNLELKYSGGGFGIQQCYIIQVENKKL